MPWRIDSSARLLGKLTEMIFTRCDNLIRVNRTRDRSLVQVRFADA